MRFILLLSLALGLGGFWSGPEAQASEPLQVQPNWMLQTEAPFNLSPRIQGDTVLAASGTSLWAVDLASGAVRWRFQPPEGLWERSFTSSEALVWVALQDRSLVALDRKSGRLVWKQGLGLQAQVAPLLADGVLYVVTSRVGEPLQTLNEPTSILALRATDGTVLWKQESSHYAMQTPVLSDGWLYIGGSYYAPEIEVDEGGPMMLVSLNATSGARRWEVRRTEGFVKALHATAERLVFIAYQDFLVGLSATDGSFLWKRDTGNWVPSLTGVDQVVYWGSANTRVFAYEVQSGTRLWEYDIPWGSFNYLLGAPAVFDQRLYGLSQRGYLFVLEETTGREQWTAATGLTSRVGAAFAPGHAVIGDEEGRLAGFSIPTAGSE